MPEIPSRDCFLRCVYKKSSAKEESTAFWARIRAKFILPLGGERFCCFHNMIRSAGLVVHKIFQNEIGRHGIYLASAGQWAGQKMKNAE